MKRLVLLSLILVLVALALTGCGPVEREDLGVAVTTMQVIFGRVYNGTIAAWASANLWVPVLRGLFWLVLIGGLATAAGFFASKRGCGCVVGVVLGLLVMLIVIVQVGNNLRDELSAKAEEQALHAMKDGFDQAQRDKANQYIEVLHVPLFSATWDEKECKKRLNGNSNCHPYEWTHEVNHHQVCASTDDDGNCTGYRTEYDIEHVPYFKTMVRYVVYGRLLDKLATLESGLNPGDNKDDFVVHRYLSEWMAPTDYEEQWFTDRLLLGPKRRDLEPYEYTPPADWQRYSDGLAQGLVPLVNVYHRYMNWIFTADAKAYMEHAGYVLEYEEGGLLPIMNTIYSHIGQGWAADYDFVQFVGGLEVSEEEYRAWQAAAYNYATFFSNDRQGSLVLVFAPREKIDDLDRWATAIKAYYSEKGEWDIVVDGETWKRLLPKNTFVLVCGVNADSTISADGCRFRTGMPHGNEAIIDAFFDGDDQPEMQGVIPFSPQGFFGNISPQLVDKEGDPYPVVQLNREGTRPMDMPLREDPDGARRISMEEYDYLQVDVVLDQAEIDTLVAREVQVQADAASRALASAFQWLVGLIVAYALAVGALAYGASSSSSGSSYR